MEDFRYAQFCPLARTAEILGHRWVLLILRELLLGPQRFSDLRRRLPGISRSVLSERLALLESRNVVQRGQLPPPAAAAIYELTDSGRALRPAVIELARWGTHFLTAPRPGDHMEPDWFHLAVLSFARTDPSPPHRFELRITAPQSEVLVRLAGGPEGTHPIEDDLPVDARIEAPIMVVMGLASGMLSTEQALASDAFRFEGDREALANFSALFQMDLGSRDNTNNNTGATP